MSVEFLDRDELFLDRELLALLRAIVVEHSAGDSKRLRRVDLPVPIEEVLFRIARIANRYTDEA